MAGSNSTVARAASWLAETGNEPGQWFALGVGIACVIILLAIIFMLLGKR